MEFQTLFCPTENMEIEGEKKGMALYWYIPAVEDILSKKFSIGPHSSWLFGQENKLSWKSFSVTSGFELETSIAP